jgi:chaperonin GroES
MEAKMNSSGLQPLDLRVVVKPDSAETITKGGIIIPETTKEKQSMAAVNGTLVAAGCNAWEDMSRRGGTAPTAGARIMFAKYGGVEFKGADGETYRIMNDDDVVGLLEG